MYLGLWAEPADREHAFVEIGRTPGAAAFRAGRRWRVDLVNVPVCGSSGPSLWFEGAFEIIQCEVGIRKRGLVSCRHRAPSNSRESPAAAVAAWVSVGLTA